jgi:hypothetical protein
MCVCVTYPYAEMKGRVLHQFLNEPCNLNRDISPLSQTMMNSSMNRPAYCGLNVTCKGNVSPDRRSNVDGAMSNGGKWTVSFRATV